MLRTGLALAPGCSRARRLHRRGGLASPHYSRAWSVAQRATRYYARALARLDDRWAGTGPERSAICQPTNIPMPKTSTCSAVGRFTSYLLRADTDGSGFAGQVAAGAGRSGHDPGRQAAIDELRETLDLREALGVLRPRRLRTRSLRCWYTGLPSRRCWPIGSASSWRSSWRWRPWSLVGLDFFGSGRGWFLLVAILQALLLRHAAAYRRTDFRSRLGARRIGTARPRAADHRGPAVRQSAAR